MPPTDTPATKQSIAYFCKKHTEHTNMKYMLNYGKDMSIMKSIAAMYGFVDTCKLIDLYFDTINKDEFLQKAGISVGVFRSQLPKLVPTLSQKKENGNKGKW